jgi:2-dehydro-3-deoxy-D-gluconate 5-dehydrogenase
MNLIESLFSIEGKTAIVTGASRGLGRAIALALNGAGADVVLTSRTVSDLEETHSLLPLPYRSLIIGCDVNSHSNMMSVFDSAQTQFGSVDILVNNAGIIRRSPVLEYSEEDWNDVIETDLNAVFKWSQEAGKRMKATGGKIINIASVLSFSGGVNVAAYAAAKGVAQLTKAMANELAAFNIQVNAIAPGYFVTDATSALRANDTRREFIRSRIPAGRFGEPDELAGAAIYLASKASDYMTGHILCVDGGWNSY